MRVKIDTTSKMRLNHGQRATKISLNRSKIRLYGVMGSDIPVISSEFEYIFSDPLNSFYIATF